MPRLPAEHHVSRYPRPGEQHLLAPAADGYSHHPGTAPGGCSPDRHGPRGEHAAYRGGGHALQRAWDEARAPGSGPATREPSPATTRDPASSTSAGTAEAPCPCS